MTAAGAAQVASLSLSHTHTHTLSLFLTHTLSGGVGRPCDRSCSGCSDGRHYSPPVLTDIIFIELMTSDRKLEALKEGSK